MNRVTTACSLALLAFPAVAAEQVTINLAGLRMQNGLNQTRDSAPQTITPAFRYSYAISSDTLVRGQGGVLGVLYPNPTPLATVLQQMGVTQPLSGSGVNPTGAHPYDLPAQQVNTTTTLGGLNVTFVMTAGAGVHADGVVYFSFTNVSISPALLVGSMIVTQGTVTVRRHCLADLNLDGGVTIDDLLDYLQLFADGLADADVTGDGGVTIDDLLVLLPHFFDGC